MGKIEFNGVEFTGENISVKGGVLILTARCCGSKQDEDYAKKIIDNR
jgi:hypothetical protein